LPRKSAKTEKSRPPSEETLPALGVLKPQHEAFCQAYARVPNGAAAARAAGYSPGGAAYRARDLLKRSDIAVRVAELREEIENSRQAKIDALIAKLEPVYDATLAAGDYDGVMQVVELQARIAGFIQGGQALKARLRLAARTKDTAGSETMMSLEAALEELDAPAEVSDESP